MRGPGRGHVGGSPLGGTDLRHHNALSTTLIDAAAGAGYPRNDDFNGERLAGFGLFQVTQRNGARCSSADAFLKPVRERANLHVRTGALVERVLVERERAIDRKSTRLTSSH